MSDWICEFCYKPASGDLPHSWELILQSAVCQECREKIAKIGGYKKVIGGAFAFADDPRLTNSPEHRMRPAPLAILTEPIE